MGREGNTSRGWEDEIRKGRQLKKEAVKLVIKTGNWSLIPQGKLWESETEHTLQSGPSSSEGAGVFRCQLPSITD